jgi:hypothetical protein
MNKEQTDWQPEAELLAWAKQHFESIPVNGVWSPDSTGVQYMKTDEKTWLLMSMYEHPDSKDYHNKMLVLMNAVGYEVATPDGFETITPPLDPSHQAEMHYQQKQELAMGWKCDCGEPLANFELENRTDEYVETIEAQLDNGQSAPLQLWRCHIPMEPDDYHVLAGDELFMQFTNMTARYTALTRMQNKDLAESGMFVGKPLNDKGSMFCVLGETYEGERVPPWLWGCLVVRTHLPSEENE